MHLSDVDGLDSRRAYWIPAVVSPRRNWPGAPGCRRGARYLVDRDTLTASRDAFEAFEDRLSCLQWIMHNRIELNQTLPDAPVRAVRLDRWLLGLE